MQRRRILLWVYTTAILMWQHGRGVQVLRLRLAGRRFQTIERGVTRALSSETGNSLQGGAIGSTDSEGIRGHQGHVGAMPGSQRRQAKSMRWIGLCQGCVA